MTRRSSCDQGSGIEVNSRKNFDASNTNRSIYKLDPNYTDPKKTVSYGFNSRPDPLHAPEMDQAASTQYGGTSIKRGMLPS